MFHVEHFKPLPLDTTKLRSFVRSFFRFYCALLTKFCILKNRLREVYLCLRDCRILTRKIIFFFASFFR